VSSTAALRAAATAATAAAPGATMQRADSAAAAQAVRAREGSHGPADSEGTGIAVAPLGTVVPLHEVARASSEAEVLSASEACKEVVVLLGLLEAVNRVSVARSC